MIRVLDSAGSTLVEWGRQQQQQSAKNFNEYLFQASLQCKKCTYVDLIIQSKLYKYDLLLVDNNIENVLLKNCNNTRVSTRVRPKCRNDVEPSTTNQFGNIFLAIAGY